MADSDLAVLITSGSEDLDVEYKAWMDTSQSEARAKLARHLAALANHGGGYLIFGVDEVSRKPEGATTLDRSLFNDDAVSGIVKRYLDPTFQCQTVWVTIDGVEYPVITVPPHGARPVIAKTDGPTGPNGRPIGFMQGQLYVRAPGPESVAIKTPEDWTALLERCLSHRADMLAAIMHRVIGRPTKPNSRVPDMLKAACDDTAKDFIDQVEETQIPSEDEVWFRAQSRNFSVHGYALVGNDGEGLAIDNASALNTRVSTALQQYCSWRGRTPFRQVRSPERTPQVRLGALLGHEATYLEGMRLPATAVIGGNVDYWRIYEQGIITVAESYFEDTIVFRTGSQLPYLLVKDCLAKLHSVLGHVRLVGQEMPAVNQIVLRMDWRGLSNRLLCWTHDEAVLPGKKLATNQFVKTLILPWSELRDTYFSALRHVALPLFGMFDAPGFTDAATWLTQDIAEDELSSIDNKAHLFAP